MQRLLCRDRIPLYTRVIYIYGENVENPSILDKTLCLASPLLCFDSQAKYAEAEQICKRSLAIREKVLASDHPDIAKSLNTLAELFRRQVGNIPP